MGAYYWAIQLRAADQVVRKQMPARVLVVRVILFCEIASSLLMIQLGQYSHWAMCFIPFFLMSIVAMNREKWDEEEWTWEPRIYFLSMLTPKNFSLLGLRKKQKGAMQFVSLSMAVRLACLIPLLLILGSNKCPSRCVEHWCFECVRYDVIQQNGCPGDHGWELVTKSAIECGDHAPKEWVLSKWEPAWRGEYGIQHYGYFRWESYFPEFPNNSSVVEMVPKEVSQGLCLSIRPPDPFRYYFKSTDYGGAGHHEYWQLNVSSLCQHGALKVPGMLTRSCQHGEADPVQYLGCRTGSWLPGGVVE